MTSVVATLAIHQRASRSMVIRGALTVVIGLTLTVLLLVRTYGNLKMFTSYEASDHYTRWLRRASEDGDILYPVIPKGQSIWVFRVALLLAIALHIWSAVTLSVKAIKNRGDKYQVTKRQAQTYASRIIRWGGVIILVSVIFHLIQFTIVLGILGGDGAEPHTMVIARSQQWWTTMFYVFSTALVYIHIRRGFRGTFATLGGNLSASSRKWLNIITLVVSVVLYAGFMTIPLCVQFRIPK